MKTMNSLASCAFTAIVGALLLTAAPTLGQDAAPAQPPQKKFGFYAGYAFLHTDDGNLNGVRLAPEYRVKGPLSVVGDFSAEFGKLADTDTTLLTFMGGLRAKKSFGAAAIYVHGLAGGVRTSSSITPFQGVSISVSDTGLGLDGGGGIEFKLSKVRMRLGADYLRHEVDTGGGKTENVGDIRATVGFVF